jgi:hypothetical protein
VTVQGAENEHFEVGLGLRNAARSGITPAESGGDGAGRSRKTGLDASMNTCVFVIQNECQF